MRNIDLGFSWVIIVPSSIFLVHRVVTLVAGPRTHVEPAIEVTSTDDTMFRASRLGYVHKVYRTTTDERKFAHTTTSGWPTKHTKKHKQKGHSSRVGRL